MLLGLQVWTCLENSFWSTWCNNTALCVFFNPVLSKEYHSIFNRSWRISTTPNTTKFFLIIFKLIQQSIMVILSCLAKKNQNLNSRKKSSVYYWKLRFQGRNACKLPFLVINWPFFLKFKFWSLLRMIIIACCISFKMIKKFLVVLGVVDMRQLLLIIFIVKSLQKEQNSSNILYNYLGPILYCFGYLLR